MRVAGKHNNEHVLIAGLCVGQMAQYVLNRPTKGTKRHIIEKWVPNFAKKQFGVERPFRIMNKDEFPEDNEPELPEIVYAHLTSPSLLFGKEFVMFWFQKSEQDAFIEARKHFKSVDWENESRDFTF